MGGPAPGERNAETLRPTARTRPLLRVRTRPTDRGFAPDDPYVRRYWVAAIGPGAVAELLRLIRTGEEGGDEPLPRWLPVLIRSELVSVVDGCLVVSSRIPAVPRSLQRRFSPGLRDGHRRALLAHRQAGAADENPPESVIPG